MTTAGVFAKWILWPDGAQTLTVPCRLAVKLQVHLLAFKSSLEMFIWLAKYLKAGLVQLIPWKVSECFIRCICLRREQGSLLPKGMQPLLWQPDSSACLVQSHSVAGTHIKPAWKVQYLLLYGRWRKDGSGPIFCWGVLRWVTLAQDPCAGLYVSEPVTKEGLVSHVIFVQVSTRVLVQELATLSTWLQQVEGWGSSLLPNGSLCVKPTSSGMWSLKPAAGCWVNSQADLSPGKSSPQGLLWLKVFSISITKRTSPVMNAQLSRLSLPILNKNLMSTLFSRRLPIASSRGHNSDPIMWTWWNGKLHNCTK